MTKTLLISAILLLGTGCSVVTLPVKVAAKTIETTVDTATTAVRVAGKVVDLADESGKVAEKAAQ